MTEPLVDLIFIIDSFVTIILKVGAISVIMYFLTKE